MSSHEAVSRGQRAVAATDEFLGPAMEAARADYLAALTTIAANEPWATDKITKLAIATRVIDLVEAHMRSLIGAGQQAAHSINHAEKIASVPSVKRRWGGF